MGKEPQQDLIAVEETLSPREEWIVLHGIETTEKHTITVKGVKLQVPHIAARGKIHATGDSRIEAIRNLAEGMDLAGWRDLNWDD